MTVVELFCVKAFWTLKPSNLNLTGISDGVALGEPRPSIARELQVQTIGKYGAAPITMPIVNLQIIALMQPSHISLRLVYLAFLVN
jgi:hypothetical protein